MTFIPPHRCLYGQDVFDQSSPHLLAWCERLADTARIPTIGKLKGRVKLLEQEALKRQEAEKALREGEKRLSQIVDGIPIPTFVINKDHLFTHANKAYEELTGITASSINGTRKQWQAFYSSERQVLADFIVDEATLDEVVQHYGENVRRSAAIKGAYEHEGFFPKISKWLYLTAAPLFDSEGKIAGAVETLQDVTERAEAERALLSAEQRYRRFLEFLPYPVIVRDKDRLVTYLNPAFTKNFGWTLAELKGGEGKQYVPSDLKNELGEKIQAALAYNKSIVRLKTRRVTKDGHMLTVIMRVGIRRDQENQPSGMVIVLRDVTMEERIDRDREAMSRISMALPQYPELDKLLFYVNNEIKELLGAEGANVLLLTENQKEFFFLGSAYDDPDVRERLKKIRFPIDELVSGQVVKTGEPVIMTKPPEDPRLYRTRDQKLGYKVENLIIVPLRTKDRIIGVLSADNKKEGQFDQTDLETLSTIASTVALSIENAHVSEELRKAYEEVKSLNKAKDKMINHLSHELKTPVAILSSSFSLLSKKLDALPADTWQGTVDRIRRNLDRIIGIQSEVDDIVQNRSHWTTKAVSTILEQWEDELETLIAEEVGERGVTKKIREKIKDILRSQDLFPEVIPLDQFVKERIEALRPLFAHRQVELIDHLHPSPPAYIPPDPLQKVMDGLIRNAIENTPDEEKIEVYVQKKGEGTEVIVRDYGIGITEEAQKRIFEGFFSTQDTMDYSSKKPFDFNAGGKGADLLRMKIFSERYNFKIDMTSKRCQRIPEDGAICPGKRSACEKQYEEDGIRCDGTTTFRLYFPPAPDDKKRLL